MRNIFLICLFFGLLLTSFYFLRERQPDSELILEKEEFAKYVVTNYEGKISSPNNWTFILLYTHSVDNPLGKPETPSKHLLPNVVIHNENDLIEFLIKNKINYLIVDDEPEKLLNFSRDIYFNEEKYLYLSKVFDSDFNDYQKYRVKIFEVDYSKLE